MLSCDTFGHDVLISKPAFELSSDINLSFYVFIPWTSPSHPRQKQTQKESSTLIHHYDGNFQGFWYKKEIYNSHISYVSIEEKIPILRFDLYFQFLLYRQGWILYRVRLTVSTSGLSIWKQFGDWLKWNEIKFAPSPTYSCIIDDQQGECK